MRNENLLEDLSPGHTYFTMNAKFNECFKFFNIIKLLSMKLNTCRKSRSLSLQFWYRALFIHYIHPLIE